MRKETNIDKKHNFKIYTIALVCISAILVMGMLYYNFSKSDNDETYIDKIASANNQVENKQVDLNNTTEQASTNIGKSVEETEKENETEKIAINTSVIEEENKEKQTENKIVENKEKANIEENKTVEEISFTMPVDGDIIKEFAKEQLLYSATLNEWTTHGGIDIKAEKTTVVKSAEKGTVKSIKNDPRYGLTIVIEHAEGFSTVYANLLTSEFVVEGEEVEKGQTIGTVGNTAVFEITDESHLHFEILKDNIQVDPSIYLK